MRPDPRPVLAVLALALAPLAAPAAVPGPAVLHLDAAASSVSFDLGATGHDVHGLFTVRSGEIAFDLSTGEASGEILVDAGSGKTGNGSRDKTMNSDVLEAQTYPTFAFRATSIEGVQTPSGDYHVILRGTLAVHGAEHPASLDTTVTTDGEAVHAHASLQIPYVEWGMHDPSILFLRVEKVVSVTIKAEGRLEVREAPAAAAPAP